MGMNWKLETITPAKAQKILDTNMVNRHLNRGTVLAYAEDIKNGRWDTQTTACIAIDKYGNLKDGQHRLNAIILADKPVKMWVCYGVGDNVVFDCGRTRSLTDYMRITYPDIDKRYTNNTNLAMIRAIVVACRHNAAQKVTPHECEDFLFEHKDDFDAFFDAIPYGAKSAKLSVTLVLLSMFMAYKSGVALEDLAHFYSVLVSGMGEGKRDFPIIAYRNYLLNLNNTVKMSDAEIRKCQGAIKKYLTNSGLKRVYEPREIIYPYPYR
jgi:hypothetical protein